MITEYVTVTGTGKPAQGAADITIVAAQGAGKKLYVLRGIVSVTVVAAVAGGEVALEDGLNGTRFWEADADASGFYSFDFGDEGFPLTANTLLNATVDGSGGNQASARVTVVCKVV